MQETQISDLDRLVKEWTQISDGGQINGVENY